jgi:hypothetical protein
MNQDNFKPHRRSTRLTISIPIVISGADADGSSFSENVHTLVVNKHGARIAATHRLTLNTEVLVENRALGVVAKASVAWLGEKVHAGDLHPVGIQLLEARNVWGITFPPDDWGPEPGEGAPPTPTPL